LYYISHTYFDIFVITIIQKISQLFNVIILMTEYSLFEINYV